MNKTLTVIRTYFGVLAVIFLIGLVCLVIPGWWWIGLIAMAFDVYTVWWNVKDLDYDKIPIEKWDRGRLIAKVWELDKAQEQATYWKKEYMDKAQLTDDEYAVLTQIAFHLTAYDKQKGKISAEATLNHLRAALNHLGPEFSKEATEDFGPQEWNQMYESIRSLDSAKKG